jgi:2-C-methyl-D-erythritol 4-phosphate cytidylyltransferase
MNSVIIVAGGKGNRMKSDVPKQFLLLNGEPVLVHTIRRFLEFDSNINIVLVLPKDQISTWQKIVANHKIDWKITITEGGETRYQSVQNGILATERTGVIGIHDGVRPMVSVATIARCFSMAFENGNAIPCLPIDETVRHLSNNTSTWVNRDEYKTIQTPQCFKAELIKDAYEQGYNSSFTDDASVFESSGGVINLVEGNKENIKITRPGDIELAEFLLAKA